MAMNLEKGVLNCPHCNKSGPLNFREEVRFTLKQLADKRIEKIEQKNQIVCVTCGKPIDIKYGK
jgi:hypothetical protein